MRFIFIYKTYPESPKATKVSLFGALSLFFGIAMFFMGIASRSMTELDIPTWAFMTFMGMGSFFTLLAILLKRITTKILLKEKKARIS